MTNHARIALGFVFIICVYVVAVWLMRVALSHGWTEPPAGDRSSPGGEDPNQVSPRAADPIE